MKYVIEVRQIADSTTGLVTQEGKVLKFESKDLAREFGKKEIEKSRYIASWEAISIQGAINRGHHM